MFRFWMILTALAAALIWCAPASADVVYQLTADSCTGGCGTPPYGTVTLHQATGNTTTVTVTVNLSESSSKFINTGNANNHESFSFNAPAGATIVLADTSKFQLGPVNAFNNNSWGKFAYSINCKCGPGGSAGVSENLVFDVTLASGLSVNSFVANSKGYMFAADILSGLNGKTGVVGLLGEPVTESPEPLTLSVFGAGLAGAVAMRRRKKKSA